MDSSSELRIEDDSSHGAGIDFANPNSKLAPFYLRTSHIIAAGLLAVVFVLMTYFPMWRTDVWAHLRFGEVIATEKQLPAHEPFRGESFADHEAPYIHYQWLAQLGAYLLFDAGRRLAPSDFEHQLGGGVVFLEFAHALIVTARLLLLLFAFRRQTGSLPFAILGVLAATIMGMPNHIPIIRPQILGELAFAALLLALSRPVLSRRALIFVPLVFLLWANCHGSFPVGFVLLGIVLLGHVVTLASDRWSEVGDRGVRDWIGGLPSVLMGDVQTRRLLAVLVLSILAAMVNPHGPMLLRYSLEMGKNPNIPFMDEWKPLPVKGSSGFIFLGSILLLLPLLRWSPLRFSATQVLLLLVFGWQTLEHQRVLVWWIMVVTWIALPHAHAIYRRYLPPLLEDRSRPDLAKTIMAVMLTVALILFSVPFQWPVGSKRVSRNTPIEVARLLRENYEHDPSLSRCIFTSETQGDYLLWELRLDPPVRIFCYTHIHLFSREHWSKCMKIKDGDPSWETILDDNGVEFVVVEPELHPVLVSAIAAASDRWKVLPLENKYIFVAQRKHTATNNRPVKPTP